MSNSLSLDLSSLTPPLFSFTTKGLCSQQTSCHFIWSAESDFISLGDVNLFAKCCVLWLFHIIYLEFPNFINHWKEKLIKPHLSAGTVWLYFVFCTFANGLWSCEYTLLHLQYLYPCTGFLYVDIYTLLESASVSVLKLKHCCGVKTNNMNSC